MYIDSSSALLNHLSFPSNDMEATGLFFEKYLGCKITHKMKDAWVVKFGNTDIVIENVKPGMNLYPHNFHFGFELTTLTEVHSIYKNFQTDEVKLETEIFNNTRGSRFFARTNCGILFEVNTREDMQPELWKNNL